MVMAHEKVQPGPRNDLILSSHYWPVADNWLLEEAKPRIWLAVDD